MPQSVVSTVIDQLAEELSRSVVINDPAVQMLYTSAHYGDEDPVRVRALLNHGAEPRARGHVLAQGVSNWTRAGLIPPDMDIGMHARVCVPIRFEGELLGLLMVMDADGSITTAELGRVNEVAQELAYALHDSREEASPGSQDEQLVLDLVGTDPSARRSAIATMNGSGRGERFTAVTAVDIRVAGPTTTTRPHVEIALRNALSARPRADKTDSMFAVTGESAVLLVGSQPRNPQPVSRRVGQILDRTHELASGRFRCVAGLGSTGDGLDHASRSLAQANLACRAAALGLGDEVTPWESLGAYGPLLLIPPEHLSEALLPHPLQQLRAIDADGHLAATLRAYLDSAGNGPAAAEQLHIHRTSLYYRLGRIHELAGLDVADGHTRQAVHAGFAMLDIIQARSQS
ncbi:helix-turn-helix domain-containing protein [Amycolatopsis benzoatilytica]|uniref:helix-turn-helix domain-containing protein n=1 Tax=Amycolatopsis benzoatilytica TaxID=346045 RepID=UPI000486B821|nr:helix-turn-helix domain-containing protein [Amycolatopsis benzoatilytica]